MQIQHKEARRSENVSQSNGEFFVIVNGKKAILDYTISGKEMDIFHTFTDEELRGQGLAEQLTQAAFEHAKKNGLKVIPTCDYVKSFLKKHPEWNSLAEHW